MQEQELLNAGIDAARSGDRTQAGRIFAQVVKINPSSEKGWFYLGMCLTEPDRREYCFRKVLGLNPNHAEARKQLSAVQPAPAQSPSTPPKSTPAWDSGPLFRSSPSFTPSAPSYIYQDKPEARERQEQPVSQPQAVPEVEEGKKPDAKPRKASRSWMLVLLSLPLMAACAFGLTFLLFPDQAAELMAPILPQARTPAQVVVQSPASPTIAASPTPSRPTVVPSPMPTVEYSPRFEETVCPFDKPPSSNLTCGFLVVPEDRTGDPADTIRLAVAVYRSKREDHAPDPVIFLQGGPGADAVELAAGAYDVLVRPFLDERDFIVFDQRGTGLSEPSLECEEVTKLYSQDIHGLISPSTRELVYSNAFLSCNGLMQVSGVNLNAYTTLASAADVKDLLSVLNYPQANLYGASYGTRLALVVMREHPEIVRGAILDSVVPVEGNLFHQYPETIEAALRALFDSCAEDDACHAAYPDLETVFWNLVSDLDANPVTVTSSMYPVGTITETVSGSTFLSVVLGSVRDPYFIGTAPQTIYRFHGDDYSTLLSAQYSLPFLFEGISPGLYISMMCHELVLATLPEELDEISTRRGVQDYGWLPFYGDANDIYRACQSWGSTGPYLGENKLVESDIPSLVIAGTFDPATPPFFARQVADRLGRSYYFEFANQGHTPTASDESGCAMAIARDFLEDPDVEPDRDCMDDLPPVEFIVPYTGDPPLELETREVWGVTVEAPQDWWNLGDGFFFRANSPIDITQIGVFQDFLTPEELVDWFSLGAYGYRGLDSPPFQVGQRQANGLTWSLYISSSNGRPVDIAMADYGFNSLVVIMFSNMDEHEALYNTVFLPMVDSAR